MESKKIYLFFGILALIGLVIGIRFYQTAFPIASMDINFDKKKAAEIAVDFMKMREYNISGYRSSIVFSPKSFELLFLERAVGLEESNKMIQNGTVNIWSWEVRFFQEFNPEEYYLYIDTKKGEITSFSHEIEDIKPGEKLGIEDAKSIAESFLINRGIELEDYELVESSSQKRENRTDHFFEWKNKNFKIPWKGGGNGYMKIKVDVYGDEIGYFSLNFIEYPENFERNIIEQLNVGNFITVISFFVTFIFGIVGVFIIFLKKFIKGEDVIIKGVRWKLFIPLSVIVFIIGFLMDFNLLPIAISNYDTTQSYINYMGNLLISYIVIAFSYAGFVFFLGPLSEFISRDMNPKTTAFFDFFRGEPKEKEIRRSVIIGLMFAVICFGYVVSFYVIGSRYFGVWSFIGSSYSSSFDSLIPFLYPLGIGVIASVTEEFGYRLFFIPMLKKYFKLGMMSFIIPAILWSFAHSTYAVFPIYVRGIEIGILGIVYGIIYMNFGILATIISHCTYNAIVTSIPLLVSMNFYYMVSAVLAILSVPLTIFLITLIRGKKNS